MKNARCFNCGLVIQGRWRNGPPKKCPRCGFEKSADVLREVAKAQAVKKPEEVR